MSDLSNRSTLFSVTYKMQPHIQCRLNLMLRGFITITCSVKKLNHATPHSVQTLLGCKVLQFTTQNIHYLIPDPTST